MLDRVIARLRRGGLVRAVVLVASGTLMAHAVILVAQPLLTRLYSPEAFGAFAVFFALSSMLGSVANLRYENAIPLAADLRGATDVTVASAAAACVTTLLTAVLVWLFGTHLAAFAQTPALVALLWLLPPSILAAGLFNAANQLALRERAFRAVGTAKVVQSLGQVGWQAGQGFLAPSAGGLIAGYVAGNVAGVLAFAAGFSPLTRRSLRTTQRAAVVSAIRRWIRFPLLSTPSLLLNSASKMLPALLLAALFGPVVAGLFGLAQRIVFVPVRLLGFSIAQVYIAEAPRLARADPTAMRRVFCRTVLHLGWIGALAIGAIALPGPWLFGLVFGAEWSEAGRQVQVLAPMFLMHFIVYPVGQTLNIYERQDLNLYWDIGNVAIMAASFATAALLDLTPLVTLLVYSLGMSASYLAALFLIAHVIRTHEVTGAGPGSAVGAPVGSDTEPAT